MIDTQDASAAHLDLAAEIIADQARDIAQAVFEEFFEEISNRTTH